MRRNVKTLANCLTSVTARAVAGSTLMGAYTSQFNIAKNWEAVAFQYDEINELLAYEKAMRR